MFLIPILTSPLQLDTGRHVYGYLNARFSAAAASRYFMMGVSQYIACELPQYINSDLDTGLWYLRIRHNPRCWYKYHQAASV